MTLQLGGGGAITGCTSLADPVLTLDGLVVGGTGRFEDTVTIGGTVLAPNITLDATGEAVFLGNVGIGTSAPDQLFHISSGANTRAKIATTSTAGFGQLYMGDEDKFLIGYGSTHPNSPDQLALRNNTGDIFFATGTSSSLERVRIDSSGNVGIGTTSPNARLDVGGQILLAEGNEIGWHDGTGTQAARIYASATDELRFERGSSALRSMTIDSSGNVGIGTSSPRGKLEVSDGTSNTAGEAINEAYIVGATTGSSEGILTIQSNDAMASNRGGSIAFGGRAGTGSTGGANWAFINGYKENGTTGNYGGYLAFATRPNSGTISERMRIDSTGAIVLPNGSPGIQFGTVSSPATSTNLDDYEEGTWTPTATSAGYTVSSSNGYYTKVGRSITINWAIVFSAVPAANSSVAMGGVPYANNSPVYIPGIVREATNTGAAYISQLNQSSTNLGMNSMDGIPPGSTRTFRVSEIYVGSLTYFTA